MRRFVLVYVFFLGAVLPSSGSPDTQTDWLLSHPLTLMDWAIMNLDKHLSDRLIPQQPTPNSMPDADTKFHASLASHSIKIEEAFATYDFDTNRIALTITTVASSPTPDDCRLVLDETRNLLLSGFGGDDQLPKQKERKQH